MLSVSLSIRNAIEERVAETDAAVIAMEWETDAVVITTVWEEDVEINKTK
jgi:hypothetical protein